MDDRSVLEGERYDLAALVYPCERGGYEGLGEHGVLALVFPERGPGRRIEQDALVRKADQDVVVVSAGRLERDDGCFHQDLRGFARGIGCAVEEYPVVGSNTKQFS